jgi:ribosomal protein S18 acetylase RimI-like enzyme
MTAVPSRDAVYYRPCTPEDVPFLRDLYGTTREEEMRMVPWTDEQKTQFLDSQFHAQKKHYEEYYGNAQFFVIETGGTSIGRLYVYRDEEEIHILDIALMPHYRGHGLGRMLLQELLDEGRATGRKVTIYVEHFNPARHLYDRLGFRHVDTNGVYHFMVWTAAHAT